MRKAVIIYSLILPALGCLWFFGAYVPYHKAQKQKISQIAEAQKQLLDFQQTISELPRFIERHKNLLTMRKDLDSKLYTKKDVLKLFARLREEADRKGVEVTEITPPIEELLYLNTIIPDSSQPQFLNIGLKVEGDFINFGKYIQVVEGAEYFQGINGCRIFSHGDDNSKVSILFDFKALLGSFREET